jgi:hypothetical protein
MAMIEEVVQELLEIGRGAGQLAYRFVITTKCPPVSGGDAIEKFV